jgi:hypothetical protein
MFKIVRSKETSQTAVVTGSKQRKNGVNLNNIRHEASRHLRNKTLEYMKDKHELATNS